KASSVSISSEGDGDGKLTVDADSDTGKVEVTLPGGLEAKVKIPGGLPGDAKFDIDGVGLFPGAKISTVNVNATDTPGTRSTVALGFAAPGDAAAVADWYQQQFADKSVTASRQGDTLTGKTEDGDDFVLALTQGAPGKAQGKLTITDKDAN
ncbi:MAG: hypothetical protein RL490_60, partial [Pseudomonadota bacterium]